MTDWLVIRPSIGELMVIVGAVLSIKKLTVAVEVFPASSVAVRVTLCTPSVV
ncbi:hypothetical protein ES703_72909 [subsurface metagenome]